MTSKPEVYLKTYDKIFRYSRLHGDANLSKRFHIMDYMVSRYLEIFREKSDVEQFLNYCQYPLRKTIRYNSLKINKQEFEKVMNENGFKIKRIKDINIGYEIIEMPKKPTLGSTLEYMKGYYHIQSKSSMIPPLVLAPSENDVVLDMAAAPGGKTTEMAQLMSNRGLIMAVEKSRYRTKSLQSNINRLGVLNTVIVRTDSVNLRKMNFNFDKILLDAPCSGEGIMYKDPSRKQKTSPADLKRFALNQLKLIETAFNLLKDGGRLVYSTCSIGPEEDEFIINYAVTELGMKVIKNVSFNYSNGIKEFNGISFEESVSQCIRIYPHIHNTEGFFICQLEKE